MIRKKLFGVAPTDRLGPEAYREEVSLKVYDTLFSRAANAARRRPFRDRRCGLSSKAAIATASSGSRQTQACRSRACGSPHPRTTLLARVREPQGRRVGCHRGGSAGPARGRSGAARLVEGRCRRRPRHGRRRARAKCSAAQPGSSTAAPRSLPSRRRASASLACSSGKVWTSVRTGTRGASARKSSASRAGQVGDRAHHPLAPQDARRGSSGCRSCGCRRRPPRRPCRPPASAAGTSAPDRREDDRRIERLGRPLVGAADPDRAELARESPAPARSPGRVKA